MAETLLGILGALLLLCGLVIGLLCNKYRVPGAPTIPSFNPVHWFQPWNIKEWLTPKGLKLFMTSYVCIMAGLALYLIAFGVGPLI